MLSFLLCVLATPVLLACARGFYNVFLHPLRRYPGPLLYRASFLPLMLKHCQGDSTRYIQSLHRRYGPVVRVEPNLLSFADGQSWQDIYGYRKTGPEAQTKPRGNLPKPTFGVRKNLNGISDIINANEDDHKRMRRVMNHMFAPGALTKEEPLVQRYVDKMVDRLRDKAIRDEEVDMVMWFKYVSGMFSTD
ncbi:hypothetical protein PpBr36_08829 [Pyricularia pennisetigena]|uniref:hypothetical protein n=1 Tax=Pyricularia pennisetigena TaxID=1578925 RepID=UPI00115497F1|nr:hypothetical protein PpBr36_08829 [Pyricularia pennisetigena]TLS24124.1 hypothetical protein PpBr36_08829 [Pyricularia pennisetigena]